MTRRILRRLADAVYLYCATVGTWHLIKGGAHWIVADAIERHPIVDPPPP